MRIKSSKRIGQAEQWNTHTHTNTQRKTKRRGTILSIPTKMSKENVSAILPASKDTQSLT